MTIISVLFGFAGLLIGLPVFICFVIGAGLTSVYSLNVSWVAIGHTMIAAVNKDVLVAIPLFILCAEFMLEGGLARRLVDFFMSLVGHYRGGLAITTVLAVGFFGAISGSVLAGMVAIGSIVIPIMKEKGYSGGFAAALVCSAAGLDALIPPSNPGIIFCSITGASVKSVFAASLIPGLVQMFLLLLVSWYLCRDMPGSPRASWKERGLATRHALTALLLPVIILGGIYSGIFTATESAAVACAYALFSGLFIHRSLTAASLWKALTQTAVLTGVIFAIIAAASLLSIILIYADLPQNIANFIMPLGIGKMSFLLMVIVVCLILGIFMEAIPNMYVSAPIMYPIALALGVPLTHFYVVFAMSVGIGLLTPPVAVGIYTASAISGERTQDVMRYVYPWLIMTLIISVIICWQIPGLSSWLPGLLD